MPLVLLVAAALLSVTEPPAVPREPCGTVPKGSAVTTDFIGGRFFARWQLRAGGEARFYLDTGGGFNMLAPDAVGRLGATPDPKVIDGNTITWVRIRKDTGDPAFPPIPSDERFVSDSLDHSQTIRLLAPPGGGEMGRMWSEFDKESVKVDGILGPQWFADRVWGLDYPGKRLLYLGTDAVSSVPAGCWVPLGFQVDSAGHRTMHFPRITAVVDGDSVDFLFDSGATTTLTDSARQLVKPGEREEHATSFIVHERFERWHTRHPDWATVPNAERGWGSRMIRVPVIEVAGQWIGPVWFTERPDASFRWFSQWMDRKVEGALGGSAWRYGTVVLDYPRARLAFLMPKAQ